MFPEFFLARQKGFEPPTFWFVAKHSIRLSYWRIQFLAEAFASITVIYYTTMKELCQAFFPADVIIVLDTLRKASKTIFYLQAV